MQLGQSPPQSVVKRHELKEMALWKSLINITHYHENKYVLLGVRKSVCELHASVLKS